MLASVAKQKLNTIVIKSSESVNEYYHRLFKLWQQASTPKDQRVEKFKLTLKPSISAPLLALKHTNLRDLLESARLIKDQKKEINNNFPKDSPRPMRTFCPWESNRWANKDSAAFSTATPAASKNLTAAVALKNTRLNVNNGNNENNARINTRFGAVSTKPQSWIGAWYNFEAYPPKLQGDNQIILSRQKRCWRCKGSGHRGNNPCCPLQTKRLNTMQAVEEANLGLEKA